MHQFTDEEKQIKIHGIAIKGIKFSVLLCTLNVPSNTTVTIYNPGCCGMVGSFGYEKEHYQMHANGEDTLFQR
jgi:hypothetical protein